MAAVSRNYDIGSIRNIRRPQLLVIDYNRSRRITIGGFLKPVVILTVSRICSARYRMPRILENLVPPAPYPLIISSFRA